MDMKIEIEENSIVIEHNNIEDIKKSVHISLNACRDIQEKIKELEKKIIMEERSIAEDEKSLAIKEEDVKTSKMRINTNKAVLIENKNQCDLYNKDEERLREQMHDCWDKGHDMLDKLLNGEQIDTVNIINSKDESLINKIEEKNGINIVDKEDVIEEEFKPCEDIDYEECLIVLLEILYDHTDGKAELGTDIYPKIANIFNVCPYELVPSGTDIKWKNVVRWARKIGVDRGLINSSVKRGVYEITEKGRRFVEENRKNKKK